MKYNLPAVLIKSYDDLYTNLTDRFPSASFSSRNPIKNHQLALELIHYAIDTRLHWSPETVRDHLNMDTIRILKIQAVLRYIILPGNISPENNLYYVAWLIWPETKNRSDLDVELDIFQSYIDNKSKRLPPDFFSGPNGLNRASNCLIYALNKYSPVSMTDIFYTYEFFSAKQCLNFLSSIKLLSFIQDANMSPLEFLHTSLGPNQKSDLLFSYFNFLQKNMNASRII